MGAIALGAAAVVGLGAGIAGTAMSASSAKKKRKELASATDKWLPDIDAYTDKYFKDLLDYSDEATRIADTVGETDMARALRLRETALPGIGKASTDALSALAPLLKGELPPSIMRAFQNAGGASTVGAGMGGSGFGFLNTGLFGARGALGAMQTGFSLLPSLMSTLPNVNSPSTAAFLQSIMTPAQRTQTQLQVRQQNIGIQQTLAGMPTSKEVWGGFLQETGGALFGGAVGGLTGGMGGIGGGAGAAASGPTMAGGPNWTNVA